MRKITPSPLNKICAPWHIPCWTINLSLLSLSTTRPFTVKRKEGRRERRGEEVVVVGLSLLCMSQQMKKLAEKRHLLVVTLVSPGSHRIMSRVAVADWEMAERGGGGGGGGERAARSYRWLCITSNERCGGNMNMWCAGRQTRDSLKNVACKGKRRTGRRERGKSSSECTMS